MLPPIYVSQKYGRDISVKEKRNFFIFLLPSILLYFFFSFISFSTTFKIVSLSLCTSLKPRLDAAEKTLRQQVKNIEFHFIWMSRRILSFLLIPFFLHGANKFVFINVKYLFILAFREVFRISFLGILYLNTLKGRKRDFR